MYTFSLILATLGRTKEISGCLQALSEQEYQNFEVILVDQNPKGFLDPIISPYEQKLHIRHILTDKKGLSRARNLGLPYASGDIIGFPDDDCEYFPDTLKKVKSLFDQHQLDALTGTITHDKNTTFGTMIRSVNRYTIWKRGISYTFFYKNKLNKDLPPFDEILGVGSGTPYGSGEETDFMLNIIEKGYRFCNTDQVKIWHPDEKFYDHKKAYNYSVGRMYVLKKHNYGMFFTAANVVFPLVKMLRFITKPVMIKYCWYQFLGRVK